MKTLDRYLIGIFIKNFLLSVLALSTLFVFQALLGALLEHRFPADQTLIYHFMGLPQVIVQMTPPSVLLATVFTLSGLNRLQELTACYSIGYGLKRIVGLFLGVAFIISFLMVFLQDRILPLSFKKQQVYYWREMKRKPDFFLDVKQDKIWYRSKNLIYNLRSFERKSNTIHGMAVYTFDEAFNLIQVVEAERAEFTDKGWKLKKGTVTVFSEESTFPLVKGFEEKALVIGESPKDFQEIEKEVDGLRLKELYRYIGKRRDAGADTKPYEAKFHAKISMSFIPLVLCVLGVPFSVRGRREGGAAKDLGLCLLITFFYWLFYAVGLSLGANGALPPWLAAWLPSAIFAALAVMLIARRS